VTTQLNTGNKPENANRQSLISELPFRLNWTHYQVLMRIENADER